MSHLELTRTLLAEHTYPEPTRNHLSNHNREASKRKLYSPTKAGEVRFGKRLPDGTSVMGELPSEKHKRRAEELAIINADKAARKAKLIKMVHDQMAETDNWANKNAGNDYV